MNTAIYWENKAPEKKAQEAGDYKKKKIRRDKRYCLCGAAKGEWTEDRKGNNKGIGGRVEAEIAMDKLKWSLGGTFLACFILQGRKIEAHKIRVTCLQLHIC